MRSAAKQILFNENYYESELQNLVDAQFGAGTWTYDNFVTEITTNVSHDLITTDIHDKSHAIDITLTSVTGDFTAGEIVVSSNSAVSGKGYAKCLEFDEDVPSMVVGHFLLKYFLCCWRCSYRSEFWCYSNSCCKWCKCNI